MSALAVESCEAGPVVRLAVPAMGTRFELVLAGGDPVRLRAAGEAALAEIEEADRAYSLFRRDSLLALINRTAAERPVRLDPESFAMFAAAVELGRLALGAFDITVAPLMRVWKFHGDDSSAAEAESSEQAPVGLDLVELDPERCTIRFRRPGVSLDLGGLAKGQALHAAGRTLREAGVECALMHGGTSSVSALGAPPGTEGWRVRLGPQRGAPVVVLRDASLSVSAPRGRTVEHDGEAHGHILDPVARRPARGTDLAAAIAGSPVMAEGISTALVVLGERPPGLPASVTTVLYSAAAGWRIAGEHARHLKFTGGVVRVPASRPRRREPA